jgi:hypothetical protein
MYFEVLLQYNFAVPEGLQPSPGIANFPLALIDRYPAIGAIVGIYANSVSSM